LFGGIGSGKTEFANALKKFYKIDFIEVDEIKRYCKYYNGQNSDLFKKASLKGVSILMNTVLDKEYSFILDGRFFEFIDEALKKNYDIEINFVYTPLDSEFISSINTINKIKEKYSNLRVNFYDLHNDLVLKNLKNLDRLRIMIKHFGIKIIMDEEKIINDNKYDLDLVYKEIDRLAEFAGMKKIDKHNYISKNDSPSELGCFAWANLKKHTWFIDNVKEWLWLDKEDGVIDIIEFIKNRKTVL
jgi:hypothetical protein